MYLPSSMRLWWVIAVAARPRPPTGPIPAPTRKAMPRPAVRVGPPFPPPRPRPPPFRLHYLPCFSLSSPSASPPLIRNCDCLPDLRAPKNSTALVAFPSLNSIATLGALWCFHSQRIPASFLVSPVPQAAQFTNDGSLWVLLYKQSSAAIHPDRSWLCRVCWQLYSKLGCTVCSVEVLSFRPVLDSPSLWPTVHTQERLQTPLLPLLIHCCRTISPTHSCGVGA